MKKVLLAALFVLLLASPIAQAENKTLTPVSIHNIIEAASKSVIRIIGLTPDLEIFYGTGVVVASSEKEVILLTAKHVADSGKIAISFNGESYEATLKLFVAETDVAVVWFPPIPGVVPIKPNLDAKSEPLNTIALGYWGGQPSMTCTVGRTNRIVIDEMYDDDLGVVKGVVTSTQLVYFGYSGGALVDETGQLIGINIAFSNSYSMAVDIRYIYQMIPTLSGGNPVTFSIEYNFNQRGNVKNGWKRIRLRNTDKIKIDEETKSILDIRVMLGKAALDTASVNTPVELLRIFNVGTIINIDGKDYKIIASAVELKNKYADVLGKPRFGMNYIIIAGVGYSVTIGIEEITASK